ncbi:hypothetical protein EMIT0P43_10706 [Pseudomonas jessenii]
MPKMLGQAKRLQAQICLKTTEIWNSH